MKDAIMMLTTSFVSASHMKLKVDKHAYFVVEDCVEKKPLLVAENCCCSVLWIQKYTQLGIAFNFRIAIF